MKDFKNFSDSEIFRKGIKKSIIQFVEDGEDFGYFIYCLSNLVEDKLPVGKISETEDDDEKLDFENHEFTEIGEDYIIVEAGGDWQLPQTIKIYVKDGEWCIDVLKIGEYKGDSVEDYDIKLLKLAFGDNIDAEDLLNKLENEEISPEDITSKNIIKLDSDVIDEKSVPVENYKGVLQYICKDIKRSIKLTTYLKNELTQIFGKHNTRFKGEFYYYVWIVEFDGEIFQIFTANGKGTQFSIVGKYEGKYEDDKSNVCINFLRKMEELLDNVGDF